jgi:hypothetical protein
MTNLEFENSFTDDKSLLFSSTCYCNSSSPTSMWPGVPSEPTFGMLAMDKPCSWKNLSRHSLLSCNFSSHDNNSAASMMLLYGFYGTASIIHEPNSGISMMSFSCGSELLLNIFISSGPFDDSCIIPFLVLSFL